MHENGHYYTFEIPVDVAADPDGVKQYGQRIFYNEEDCYWYDRFAPQNSKDNEFSALYSAPPAEQQKHFEKQRGKNQIIFDERKNIRSRKETATDRKKYVLMLGRYTQKYGAKVPSAIGKYIKATPEERTRGINSKTRLCRHIDTCNDFLRDGIIICTGTHFFWGEGCELERKYAHCSRLYCNFQHTNKTIKAFKELQALQAQ